MPAQYAPGTDDVRFIHGPTQYRPQQGAGGIYASYIKGATPKYAQNAGTREESQKGTLARMFIRVDQEEFALFKESVGDSNARQYLVDRIAGDPTRPRRVGNTIIDSGYMDFFLTNVQQGLMEKLQVSETLADNYVTYTFGQSAPTWSFSGNLLNTVQDDQVTNFYRLYIHLLRASQLAKRQKIVSIKYDSFIVAGALTSIDTQLNGNQEVLCPFQFRLLVKRFDIVNFTPGWVPTNPGGAFAADPYSVAYDGLPREESQIRSFAARTPPGAVEEPAPRERADPRTNEAPPAQLTSQSNASGVSSAPPELVSSEPPNSSRMSSMQNLAASVVSSGRPETTSPPPNMSVSSSDQRTRSTNAVPLEQNMSRNEVLVSRNRSTP